MSFSNSARKCLRAALQRSHLFSGGSQSLGACASSSGLSPSASALQTTALQVGNQPIWARYAPAQLTNLRAFSSAPRSPGRVQAQVQKKVSDQGMYLVRTVVPENCLLLAFNLDCSIQISTHKNIENENSPSHFKVKNSTPPLLCFYRLHLWWVWWVSPMHPSLFIECSVKPLVLAAPLKKELALKKSSGAAKRNEMKP